jgi:CBS domain-containing protein
MVRDEPPPPAPTDPVDRLMAKPVVAVAPRLTLRSVAAVLTSENVGAVVVYDEEGNLGIVSERDVVRALAQGADPDEVWAADVMATEPRWVDPQTPIAEAAELMLNAGIRHVPVVDANEAVGIVSIRDALAVLLRAPLD